MNNFLLKMMPWLFFTTAVTLANKTSTSVPNTHCQAGYYMLPNSTVGVWRCTPCPNETISSEDDLICWSACQSPISILGDNKDCMETPMQITGLIMLTISISAILTIPGFCATVFTLISTMEGDTIMRTIGRSSSKKLKLIHLMSLIMAQITSFLTMIYLFNPSSISCAVRQVMPQLCYTMMFSSYFTQILNVNRNNSLTPWKSQYLSPKALVSIIISLTAMAVVISGLLLIFETPTIDRYDMPTQRSLNYCQFTMTSKMIPFGYNAVLICFCIHHYIRLWMAGDLNDRHCHWICISFWIICPAFVISAYTYKEKVPLLHCGLPIVALIMLLVFLSSTINNRHVNDDAETCTSEIDNVSVISDITAEVSRVERQG